MRFFTLPVLFASAVYSFTDVAPEPSADLPRDAKMQIDVLVPPPETCKHKAVDKDTVKVHYTGWSLKTGVKFDSSRDRNREFEFLLGASQVIKGWDEGVKGMCPGEVRRLTLPSGMAYGARGHPPVIAPDATLVFNVELVGFKNKKSSEL